MGAAPPLCHTVKTHFSVSAALLTTSSSLASTSCTASNVSLMFCRRTFWVSGSLGRPRKAALLSVVLFCPLPTSWKISCWLQFGILGKPSPTCVIILHFIGHTRTAPPVFAPRGTLILPRIGANIQNSVGFLRVWLHHGCKLFHLCMLSFWLALVSELRWTCEHLQRLLTCSRLLPQHTASFHVIQQLAQSPAATLPTRRVAANKHRGYVKTSRHSTTMSAEC